jgi:sugar transferase (PEP-CTERM/EpsH1 system associated)
MKVLFLTHRVPYAPNRGDRIRAFHILRFLKSSGFQVCLVALAQEPDEHDPAHGLANLVDELHLVRVPRRANLVRAALRLAGRRTLTHLLLDSPELGPLLDRVRGDWRPDVVLALCSSMARFALQPPLSELPLVIDLIDVDSFKWQSLAEQSSPPISWIYSREARLLRQFEIESCRAADANVVVSEKEADALHSLDARLRASVVPHGVDVERFRRDRPPTGQTVVFTGVFSYRPNLDGAFWLLNEVWPQVSAQVPEAKLCLVGSGPPAALRRAGERAGAVVTGTVPEVGTYLWEAALAVAPLHTARGVQNKVLEGVAAGLPAVVTPAVYEGLPDEVRPACLVASSADAFAAAIVELLRRSPEERRDLVRGAPIHLLGWDRCLEPLGTLLREAARSSRPKGPLTERH